MRRLLRWVLQIDTYIDTEVTHKVSRSVGGYQHRVVDEIADVVRSLDVTALVEREVRRLARTNLDYELTRQVQRLIDEEWDVRVNSESLIDDVVDRIKRKQIM